MQDNNRRSFLKNISGAAALLTASTATASAETIDTRIIQIQRHYGPNDKVRVGLIGAGIIGHYDLETALKVPGVELAGVCDLYEGRLIRAKEKWGNDLLITRDYRELIARKDIDAVLVCTSDHWHDHISIAALKAGKHVYCEKPMVHHIDEGHAVIEAHKKSGKVFQVGSQRASSAAVHEAKKFFEQGIIGQLEYVETANERNSANGAWQYTMPNDATAEKVSWDKYLGDAPKKAFQPERFFRWRNYKDYGTGVAGDLIVHQLTELHTITGSLGPNRVYALGAINVWKDGRDAYDLIQAMMHYPKTDKLPAFQYITRINLADGAQGPAKTRLVGTEGVIEMHWTGFKISTYKRPAAPDIGGYDALESYPKAMQEELLKAHKERWKKADLESQKGKPIEFKTPAGYDDRLDHMFTFFDAIRENKQVLEDSSFGLRAAGPSLACNISVEKQSSLEWDPIKMKLG